MKSIKLLSGLLAIVLLAFVAANCGKKDVPPDNNNNTQDTFTLRLNKYAFKAYEIGVVRSSQTFSQDTFEGRLGDKVMVFKKTDDSRLSFLVPDVPTGDYDLKLQSLNYNLSLSITEAAKVQAPLQELSAFVGNYDKDFDDMKVHVLKMDSMGFITDKEAQIAAIETMRDSTKWAVEQFKNLSMEEQQQAMQFINANREALDELNRILDGIYQDGSFKKATCETEKDWEKAKCLINEFRFGVRQATLPAVVGGIAGSFFAGVGALPGSIIGAVLFRNTVIKGIKRAVGASVELAKWAFVPVDNVTAEVAVFKDVLKFKETPKEITYSFETRSPNKNLDANVADLGVLFECMGLIEDLCRRLNVENAKVVSNDIKKKYDPQDFSRLQMVVTNNSAVRGEVIPQYGGNPQLHFTTDEKVSQQFRFKLVLPYGPYTISSKELDAELEVINFNYEGTWQLNYFDPADTTKPYQDDIYVFDANGHSTSAKHRMYANGSPSEWQEYAPEEPFSINYDGETLNITDLYFGVTFRFNVRSSKQRIFHSAPGSWTGVLRRQ
ncbi:hypothetical protein GC194_11150 [bacterium]|nr:hypothetical protein [bacterium]